MMNEKKQLYKIPIASTGFTSEAYWNDKSVTPGIHFEYVDDDTDAIRQGGIVFRRVAAYRHRAERCCKVWHIDAYDTLVEVENSSWVDEIHADTQELWRNKWEMHHYMIYLDSVGCFEIIAESWEALQKEAKT
jgi:hypothetical protein